MKIFIVTYDGYYDKCFASKDKANDYIENNKNAPHNHTMYIKEFTLDEFIRVFGTNKIIGPQNRQTMKNCIRDKCFPKLDHWMS